MRQNVGEIIKETDDCYASDSKLTQTLVRRQQNKKKEKKITPKTSS